MGLIPYVSGTLDYAASDQDVRAGLDFNWQLNSRLGLTASVEPDFGAVEADDVVLNLTALETFFPEKRLFSSKGTSFTRQPSIQLGKWLRKPPMVATTSRRVFRDGLPADQSLKYPEDRRHRESN